MEREEKLAAALRALDRVERHLEAARAAVKAELAAYPAPITACDAQYNHLSDERRRLTGELARLAAARREIREASDALSSLDAFLAASPHLAPVAGRKIKARAVSSA